MKLKRQFWRQKNAIAAGALALELEMKIATCSVESDIEGEDSVEY